jgi:hypothetical protein
VTTGPGVTAVRRNDPVMQSSVLPELAPGFDVRRPLHRPWTRRDDRKDQAVAPGEARRPKLRSAGSRSTRGMTSAGLFPTSARVPQLAKLGTPPLFAERSSCGRSSKALVRHRRRSGGSTARSGRRASVPQLGLRAQLAVPCRHSTVVLHLPPPLRARVAIATVGRAGGGAGGWLVDRKFRPRPVGSRGACLARGHARSRTR